MKKIANQLNSKDEDKAGAKGETNMFVNQGNIVGKNIGNKVIK